MLSVPSVNLNDGSSIPAVGFGTGTAFFSKECTESLVSALKHGYRYLDSAQWYGNGASVGEAIKQWGGKREDVYILSKMGSEKVEETDPRESLEEQLKLLDVEYVDIFLVHAPYFAKPNLQENWKNMEKLVHAGLTKSIGVSNYCAEDIEAIKEVWTIPPAVNQIEYHPYVFHAPNMLRLRQVMDANNIKIQAYGPLTTIVRAPGGPVDSVVKRIAEEKGEGVTEPQVLLAWGHQYGGGCVVTTSRTPSRQLEQLESLSKVHLSQKDLDDIAEAGKGKFHRQFMHKAWDNAKP